MNRRLAIALGAFLVGLCAVGTVLGFAGRAAMLPKGQGLPDRDIVFVPENTSNTLGFVDVDGTGYEVRQVEVSEGFFKDLAKMSSRSTTNWITWGSDGRSLAGSLGRFHREAGNPFAITSDGGLLLCPDDEAAPYGSGRNWITEGSMLLTVDEWPTDAPERVLLVDMTTCSEREVLYVAGPDEGLGEAAVSSQGWLAIARGTIGGILDILVVDPQGSQISVGRDARWPTWSRDGEWLVYTVPGDGLYIVRKDGSGARKVLDEPRVKLASWSPDGEWLAYDRPASAGGIGIYKINIATGEEIEIYRGGYYPNWRWATGD